MNKLSYIIFIIFILLIMVPVIILKSYKTPEVPPKIRAGEISIINVYFYDEDKVESMELEEYIKGVVAAEMPAEFEAEALKAQAVAARTYTLQKIIKKENIEEHKGGDICTNYAHCQAYKNTEQLKDSWGILGYYKYRDKINGAVESTRDMVIVYEGELINPLFHSTSGGKTENSEEVFSTNLPYLRSVISPGEEPSPKFYGQVAIPFDQFKSKLSEITQGLELKKSDIKVIKILEESQGGRVKSLQIGNKTFSGIEIRNIFALNSTNFKINLNKDKVIIDTTGYGHGVGMSQFGANYLAKQKKGFKDILQYYYKDTQIKSSKEISK